MQLTVQNNLAVENIKVRTSAVFNENIFSMTEIQNSTEREIDQLTTIEHGDANGILKSVDKTLNHKTDAADVINENAHLENSLSNCVNKVSCNGTEVSDIENDLGINIETDISKLFGECNENITNKNTVDQNESQVSNCDTNEVKEAQKVIEEQTNVDNQAEKEINSESVSNGDLKLNDLKLEELVDEFINDSFIEPNNEKDICKKEIDEDVSDKVQSTESALNDEENISLTSNVNSSDVIDIKIEKDCDQNNTEKNCSLNTNVTESDQKEEENHEENQLIVNDKENISSSPSNSDIQEEMKLSEEPISKSSLLEVDTIKSDENTDKIDETSLPPISNVDMETDCKNTSQTDNSEKPIENSSQPKSGNGNISNASKNKLVVIDTLDLLLSDDESEKKSNKNNKVSLTIDNDDDDLLFIEDKKNQGDSKKLTADNVSSDSNKESNANENKKPHVEEVALNDLKDSSNESLKSSHVESTKTILEKHDLDVSMDECDSTSKDAGTVSAMDEKNNTTDLSKSEPVVNDSIIPLNFMKTFKSTLGRMTRDDLEEYCLVKIVEGIKRSNLNEAEKKILSLTKDVDALRKKIGNLTKQNRDLEIVMKNLSNEHKRRKSEIIEPVKISRSVGFQVGPSLVRLKANSAQKQSPSTTPSSTLPSPSLPPPPPPLTPTSSNVKNTRMKRTRQTKSNTPNSDIRNTNVELNAQKESPASMASVTLISNEDKPKNNTPPPVKNSLFNKNQLSSNGTFKGAEKRLSEQSIDLTDDEPPAKQTVLSNRSRVKPQNSMNASLPPATRLYTVTPLTPTDNRRVKSSPMLITNQGIMNMSLQMRNMPNQNQNPQQNVRIGIPIKNSLESPIQISPKMFNAHPAPLPVHRASLNTSYKWLPPKPDLKISKVPNGIVISWTIETAQNTGIFDIASYQIYAYQETNSPPHTDLWKKIGDVKALPLPMACTLTQFMAGYKYYFAVRAVDVRSRVGPFSLPGYILLTKDK